ncbi:MAG: tetratricopeptide repeat protein [Pyrinomonadaceae bacterium]
MFIKKWKLRGLTAAVLISAFWLTSIPVAAQDLVAVSSLTGSSSIFVFRSSSRTAARRVVSKPTRSKAQRMESVNSIKKQYVTLAKTTPKTNRAKIVDPTKLGPKGGRDLPPAQASKLFSGVGEYYVAKGDYDQSFDFFRDAIRLDENNELAKAGFSEALALKGNDMLVKDQAATAKGLFLEAIKYDSRNAAAYFGLGEVYSELDQQAEAIAAYEKSLQSDKGLTEIYVPLGILYYQAGEIAKADDLLSKALVKSAGNAETQFFLGLIRASQNRLEDALAAFQKAETLDPTYADAFFNTAEVLVKLNRASDAVPEYQKAISLRANYVDALIGLGRAFYELKNYPEALKTFQDAAKIKNDNWEIFAGLGESYRQSGDFEKAESNYNLAGLFLTRMKDFNPDTAADLYSKAGFVIGQQCPLNMAKFVPCKWTSAIKALEKAVEYGKNPLDQANLGWAYYNSARIDIENKDAASAAPKLEMAKTALVKAIAESPAIADGALQNLGAVQIDQGDFTGAIASLTKVVDKHPEWFFSRYALGTAYYKVNDFNNSAKWLRLVVDAQPNYIPALSSLGYAEIKRKNGKEVRQIIERLKPLDLLAAAKLERDMKSAKL